VRAGSAILSTVSEIHDATEALVATVTSTLLARGEEA